MTSISNAGRQIEYPFDAFERDFNEHRPLGFTTACSVMPNVLSDCQVGTLSDRAPLKNAYLLPA